LDPPERQARNGKKAQALGTKFVPQVFTTSGSFVSGESTEGHVKFRTKWRIAGLISLSERNRV